MKLIVAGGRDFYDLTKMINYLIELHELALIPSDPTLICGLARGADLMAKRLWQSHNMPIEYYPADWDRFGKSAGIIRNKQMGDIADAGVCFWDGKSRGTKHMIQYLQQLNKPVWICNY